MIKVRRFDYGEFSGAHRTPQGFLRIPVRATRVGVFPYRMPDGSILRELRHPDEVFKEDSLKTLAAVPVTDDHPPVAVLTPETAKQYAVGWTADAVTHDDRYVDTFVTIMDANVIASMEANGAREASCGYQCELEMTPGVWDGEEYDCIQRNIVYNHLARVDRGRAGPAVRFKLDSADGVQVQAIEKEKLMKKVKIGDQEIEVSPEAAAVVEKFRDTMQAKTDAAEAKVTAAEAKLADAAKAKDTAQAKADAADAELTKLKATATPDLKAARAARRSLERTAEVMLDSAEVTKLDEMEDVAIMKAVIKADSPSADLEGKSDTYIQARFDSIKESLEASATATTKLGKTLAGNKDGKDGTEVRMDSEAARKKSMEESQNAWKQPLSKSVK